MANAYYYYLLRRGYVGGGIGKLIRNYRSRVQSDGGVIEAIACAQQAISRLPGGVKFGTFMFGQFNTRVVADGGVTEAQTCVERDLNYLNENFTSY